MIACTKEHFENVILPRMKHKSENPSAYSDMIEPAKKYYQTVIANDGKRDAIVSVLGELGNDRYWGTAYADIREDVQAADNDPNIDRIVLDINSPGGLIHGVSATEIAIRSSKKETVARVGNIAASAAYWLACACNKIEATSKTAFFGSIGIMGTIIDINGALEKQGIKRTVIISTDAPNKNLDPSTEKGYEEILNRMNKIHAIFAEAVATGRKTTIEKVNSDFGKGGVLIAEDALKVGMIDKITIGQISNNSEEEMANERTYSQAEFDAGIKAANENLMKHARFIGRAKSESVIANMTENKPFAECVEGYCAEEFAAKELQKNIDANAPEGHVSTDAAINEKAKEEKAKAEKTVDVLNSWEAK
jgi:ClpP class serine protease